MYAPYNSAIFQCSADFYTQTETTLCCYKTFRYYHHIQSTSENWTVLCSIPHGLTFLLLRAPPTHTFQHTAPTSDPTTNSWTRKWIYRRSRRLSTCNKWLLLSFWVLVCHAMANESTTSSQDYSWIKDGRKGKGGREGGCSRRKERTKSSEVR